MGMELLLEHNKKIYIPVVEEGIEWSTERVGVPGKLTFKIHNDNVLKITEGDVIRFKWDDKNIFYGFIFSIKRDKEQILSITAYDQLRYLKNKDTYVYENKTASDVIKMIASDFKLKTGVIADTGYRIPSRVEDGQTLFDIIINALDATMEHKKTMYIMYDDFKKITLKKLNDMYVDVLIDESTIENFDYSSSIDGETYNQIKLYFDNEETGQRDVYIAKDSNNIGNWGTLQYYESIEKGEDGKSKADALLKLYNAKTKSLSIKNTFGDVRVRAGSLLPVVLNLGDSKVQNLMVVETCKHIFKENEHFMDLKLKGGDFFA